jgi:hypothetical protein
MIGVSGRSLGGILGLIFSELAAVIAGGLWKSLVPLIVFRRAVEHGVDLSFLAFHGTPSSPAVRRDFNAFIKPP